MTPTLRGRWQARVFLMGPVGLAASILFGLLYHDFRTVLVLLYMVLLGFGWDILYQALLHLRWDQDWPTLLQILAGLVEGAVIWVLIVVLRWPGLSRPFPFALFYGGVWLAVFMISQGPLRIILPRGRFRGGEWL